jgi:hypothetical protein
MGAMALTDSRKGGHGIDGLAERSLGIDGLAERGLGIGGPGEWGPQHRSARGLGPCAAVPMCRALVPVMVMGMHTGTESYNITFYSIKLA